ncbi:hypothetical protein NECAME_16666 [Necator americanus]|uniref:Uncharacterized protein n=1 Tax=Necator americanus TaxID=51031 RepID=W2TVV2_NECAM|nr:hypothetical protein NECAME_16666 [Necator americanus]ETN85764.1 hypothetical protein NECAME_16666 [Necator americanus]
MAAGTTISLKKTNITTEKHQVQDNEESYDEIEGQKSSTSQLNSKSIVIIAASALLIVFVLISIIKTQGTPSEKKGSSVRKAVADYLEAQLKTCVMAVDPEKAGGDVGTVKPEDLEDGGYFGTPKAENKQENAPENKQETPAK